MRTVRVCSLLVSLGMFLPLFGQVPAVRPNSFEVGGFAGASYGIDQFRAMGGANVTYAITKYILPYVEYSYFPGIGRSTNGVFAGTGNPYHLAYAIPLSDFHGGVHIRIPVHEKPIAPYLVFGVGALTHFDHTVTATYTTGGNQILTQQLQVPGGSDFATNFGGGIRFYVTGNGRFGFRVEAKAYKPTGAFTQVFGKVEGGIFIQLR